MPLACLKELLLMQWKYLREAFHLPETMNMELFLLWPAALRCTFVQQFHRLAMTS